MKKEELEKMIADTVAKAMAEAVKQGSGSPLAVQPPVPVKAPEPGERAGRFIRAFVASKGDMEKAAFIAEKKFGDADLAKSLTALAAKGLESGDFSAGGALVPEDMSREIIELLRPTSAVRRMNPIIVPMPNGTLTMPRLAGGANSSYIGEATSQNATQESFDDIVLTFKKLRAHVPVSNELLMTSDPAADAIVRDDLVASLGTREDQAFIRDDGTQNKPKGIRNWAAAANISATNGTTASQVEQDFQELFEALMGSNSRMLRPGILMSSRSYNFLIKLRDANGNLIYPELRTSTPTILTVPVTWTNNIPNNLSTNQSEVYLADFADVVIGESSQLTVEVSSEATYTDSTGSLVSAFDRDQTVFKAIARHDLAVRHAESIAVKTGITWGV